MKSWSHLLLIVFFGAPSFLLPPQPTGQPDIPASCTITNLYDAFGKDRPGLTRDFGFSALVTYGDKTILFDAGSNADIFQRNVEALGVDLQKIDFVVISHAHFDHLNGLDYVLSKNPKVKIYFPYDIFWGAPVPFDATGMDPAAKDALPPEMQYFEGGPTKFVIRQSGRFWGSNIEFIKKDTVIFPGISLIATGAPYMGYFTKYPNVNLVNEQLADAPADQSTAKFSELPELSLSLQTRAGEVVVVGCSHSTVQAIVAEARAFTQRTIDLVCGGFHLLPFREPDIRALTATMQKDLGVQRVAPAHCTGHLGFKLFREAYGENYLFLGLGETVH